MAAGVAVAVVAGPVAPARADGGAAAPALLTRPAADAPPVLAPGWRVATLRGKRVTHFEAAVLDGHDALVLDADASYGHLVHALEPAHAPPAVLGWRWRLERGNPLADLTRKDGDDSPVKVCLAFDLPIERVPLIERQMLRLARLATGEALPTATLCWLWDSRLPEGTVRRNVFTSRLRYVVVRGPGRPEGHWLDERRDVAADFHQAFGDEWPEAMLPPATALILSADSDNTGAHTRAAVADVAFE